MTAIVQSLPTFEEVVVLGCFKDAAVVEKIRRRRRHGDSAISRDFVILPEDVKDRDLPRDLFTRTRLRSHLKADSDDLVRVEDREVILGPELIAVQESLETKGMQLTDIRPMRCSYIRDGVTFNYLVVRIIRPY